MIDMLVRSFLGGFGGKVLDFYSEHGLWINGAILLYALLVILGRSAYTSMLRELAAELLAANPDKFRKMSTTSLKGVLSRMDLPWDKVLSKVSFPILVTPRSFRPYLKNAENAARLLPVEILADYISAQTHREDKSSDPSNN